MTTNGLVIPSGLRTREIILDGRKAGLKNARPAKQFEILVLYPMSLSENDEEKFVSLASRVQRHQWDPAFDCCSPREHDELWDWWEKWRNLFFRQRIDRNEPVESVVAVSAETIQGMMIVGPSKPARLKDSVPERLLYLAYMATAPWNRKVFSPKSGAYPESVQGVGSALVKEAILLSASYQYKGRLGLHAMGRSAGFYRKIGMERAAKPFDDELKDPWFEFSEQNAQVFLNESSLKP
jgi:hypothetical protein